MTRVCPLADLPLGSTQQVHIDGHAVLLCRNDDGVYALDDTCPHEDVSLSLGAFDGDTVRCPLHGSRFCVRSGSVLDPPAEANLGRHDVAVADDWIHVRLRR